VVLVVAVAVLVAAVEVVVVEVAPVAVAAVALGSIASANCVRLSRAYRRIPLPFPRRRLYSELFLVVIREDFLDLPGLLSRLCRLLNFLVVPLMRR